MSLRLSLGALGVLVVVLLPRPVGTQTAVSVVDFERDVQPILQQNCIGCHGPSQQMNGFRLDRRSAALRGGTQTVIVPGSAASSRLYLRLITNQFGNMMPPTAKLTATDAATIKAWIDQGARWPDTAANEVDLPPIDAQAVDAVAILRAGDLASFRKLLTSNPSLLNARGPGGATPFMYGALYGDMSLLKWMLARGGNASAHNDANATALMWTVDSLEKVQALVDAGVDVNVRSSDGRTPLTIASGIAGGTAVLRLLLDRGASPNPPSRSPADATPLRVSAMTGSADNMRLLIERGADIRAAGPPVLIQSAMYGCRECIDLVIGKVDTRALNQALLALAVFADESTIDALLKRGADVNTTDPDGRTPLLFAASSDELSLDVVRLLLDRGADVNAATSEGITALDIAERHGDTPIVALLRSRGAVNRSAWRAPAPNPVPGNSLAAAIGRSVPVLQKADADFSRNTGCQSCHNDSLTSMMLNVVRRKGFVVDEAMASHEVGVTQRMTSVWNDRHLQGVSQGGGPATVSYILLGLHAEGHKADLMTDAAAHFIKSRQLPDGRWTFLGPVCARPPLCSTDVQQTALSIRALQLYPPVPAKAAYAEAVGKASEWLSRTDANTNDERAFRVMGLAWAKAHPAVIRKAVDAVLSTQRADGGWSDIPTLESTGYATGLALNALFEGGVPVSSSAYQRGVQHLLSTQRADGTWYVRSRSLAIQPYFDNGFPHGHDQWISSAATNWATMALAHAAAPHRATTAARR